MDKPKPADDSPEEKERQRKHRADLEREVMRQGRVVWFINDREQADEFLRQFDPGSQQ